MGAEAAVNAVFANKIAAKPEAERPAYIEELRAQYRADIDIYRLASELIVDGIVAPNELRTELVHRFSVYAGRRRDDAQRHHPVPPM